jgi:hypothetical protein
MMQAKCAVCLVADLDTDKAFAFSPCGHANCCENCALTIVGQDLNCPECRSVIERIQTVYFSGRT